jgi:hypothetical protein
MKTYLTLGALALLLFAAGGDAIGGRTPAKGARVRGGTYADFLAGHLEYRAGNLDKALEWYRRR